MRIEENWEDGAVYRVQFTLKNNQTRKIAKTIIVELDSTEKEIEKLVKNCFRDVENVVSMDYMEDALISKLIKIE